MKQRNKILHHLHDGLVVRSSSGEILLARACRQCERVVQILQVVWPEEDAKSKTQSSTSQCQVGYPMQMVATYILGPLPESSSGNSYILVAADYFTQWVEAYPIPFQEAVVVARKLVNEMF